MMRRVPQLTIFLVLLAVLARHIWLAAYVHPYGDDFSYAYNGMRSILADRLLLEYQNWNGRYFSNILVLRGPLNFGLDLGLVLYRCVPVLLIGILIHASWSLLRTARILEKSGPNSLIVAMCGAAIYVHLMPHAGEGLYWYTGAVTYLLPNILLLYLGVAVLRFASAIRQWEAASWSVLAILLVVAIAGSNELAMVYMLLASAVALIMSFRGERRLRMLFSAVFITSLVCGLIVYLAPGNSVRGDYFEHAQEPIRTVGYAVAQTIRFVGHWMLSPVFVLSTIVILEWARRRADTHPLFTWLRRVDRRLVLLAPLAVVFIGMALPYWSTGILGQHRTVNATLFVFLPLAWLAFLVWDVQAFRMRSWTLTLASPRYRPLLLTVLAFFLFFGRHDGDVTSDLLSGRAARYDAQCMERYVLVQEAIMRGTSELDLEFLSDPPASLSVLDLSADAGHWMNTSLALYFGGEHLRILAVEPHDPTVKQ